MAGNTSIENRVYAIEMLLGKTLAAIDALKHLASNALQNSQQSDGGGGGSGGSGGKLVWCTAANPREGDTAGSCTVQYLNGVGNPPVLTATGDSNDSGRTAFNVTGGTPAVPAFGIAFTIGGVDYVTVLDCNSTTNAGTPAMPQNVQQTQSGQAMSTQDGSGLGNS